jgi:hypothetical protein
MHYQESGAETETVPSSSSSGVTVLAGGKGDLDEQCTLLLRLKSAGSEHIHSTAISPNGELLLMSTMSETKAWRVQYNHSSTANNGIKLIKLKMPEILSNNRKILNNSLQHMTFNKEGTLLAGWHATRKAILLFSVEGAAVLAETVEDTAMDVLKFLAAIPYEPTTASNSQDTATTTGRNVVDKKLAHVIHRLTFSDDSLYLAVANVVNEVTVFHVKKRVKHWSITNLAGSVADIQFLPTTTVGGKESAPNTVATPAKKGGKKGKDKESKETTTAAGTAAAASAGHYLVTLLSTNTMIVFECDQKNLHPCSTENQKLGRKSIPHELRFPLTGIAIDPHSNSRFFVYGQLHSIYVDLLQEMPTFPKIIAPSYALTSHTSAVASQNNSANAKNASTTNNNNKDNTEQEKRVSFAAETKANKRKREEAEVTAAATQAAAHSDDEDFGHSSKHQNADIVRSTSSNFALIETYRNILHIGWMSSSHHNSLVSVFSLYNTHRCI